MVENELQTNSSFRTDRHMTSIYSQLQRADLTEMWCELAELMGLPVTVLQQPARDDNGVMCDLVSLG